MKAMAEIEFEACRYRRLLHIARLNWWLRQLTVFVTIYRRIVALVLTYNFERFPLNIRDILHTNIDTAPRFLQFDVFRLRLLIKSLLHLPLHLALKILNVLSHLSVRRHEVVLLRQLRHVIVLQLIRRRTDHVVLLLAENGASRMLRYMRDQAIQFGESLITRVAVIMILAFQLAERPAAALLRSVQGVRRGRTHRRYDRRFCNVKDFFEFESCARYRERRKRTNLLIQKHSRKHKTWSKRDRRTLVHGSSHG